MTTKQKLRKAYSEVLLIEEKLANILPITDIEGQIARREALVAARKSGDVDRLWRLRKKYASEAFKAKIKFKIE